MPSCSLWRHCNGSASLPHFCCVIVALNYKSSFWKGKHFAFKKICCLPTTICTTNFRLHVSRVKHLDDGRVVYKRVLSSPEDIPVWRYINTCVAESNGQVLADIIWYTNEPNKPHRTAIRDVIYIYIYIYIHIHISVCVCVCVWVLDEDLQWISKLVIFSHVRCACLIWQPVINIKEIKTAARRVLMIEQGSMYPSFTFGLVKHFGYLTPWSI